MSAVDLSSKTEKNKKYYLPSSLMAKPTMATP
jgi:hypothetical protein